MCNKKYTIIGSFTSIYNDKEETNKIKTACNYIYTPEITTILYKEDNNIGFPNIDTKLTIYNNKKIFICRNSDIKTNISIEKNIRNICKYETPYITFFIGVTGKSFNIVLSSDGGNIDCKYIIDINNSLSHINTVSIQILKD